MTTAILFDHNFDQAHTLGAEDIIDSNVLAGAITIPLDHPAAQWLSTQAPERPVFAALNDEVSQYRGRLMQWEIRKRGTCTECDHCQQKVMATKWTTPPR